jgi:hypothetical protein
METHHSTAILASTRRLGSWADQPINDWTGKRVTAPLAAVPTQDWRIEDWGLNDWRIEGLKDCVNRLDQNLLDSTVLKRKIFCIRPLEMQNRLDLIGYGGSGRPSLDRRSLPSRPDYRMESLTQRRDPQRGDRASTDLREEVEALYFTIHWRGL